MNTRTAELRHTNGRAPLSRPVSTAAGRTRSSTSSVAAAMLAGLLLLPVRGLSLDWEVQEVGGDPSIGGKPGAVGGFVAGNGRVYAGGHIFDAADPAHPRSIGQYPGTALALSGDHLITVGDENFQMQGLRILDVGNPAAPVLVGSYSNGNSQRDWENRGSLAVSAIYAYWAEPKSGLHVLDISAPASPRLVARLLIAGRAGDIAVSGNFAYVAKYGIWEGTTNLVGSGLSVIDISDPTNPRFAGSYDTGGSCGRVAVAAGYAYLLEGVGPNISESLRILDVREPADPKEVGRLDIEFPGNLALSGNSVYVTAWGRLYVLDVTDRANPRLVGASAHLDEYIGDVAVVGDYVYATGSFSGLNILTLRPANPQSLGRVKVSGHPGESRGGRAAVSGNYAYLADPNAGLQVIDIHDLTSPRLVGSYTNLPPWLDDVAVSGNYAYVAADNTGLEIVDVTNPANPSRVGGLGSLGGAHGVEVSGDFAYVAGYGVGLSVIDISTPSSPRRVGSFDADQAWAVAVAGNFAYVAELWRGRLQVIDITDPATPQRIAEYQSLGHVNDVTVSGHYAFLAEWARSDGTNSFGGGLVIVNIADPSLPEEVGRYSSSLSFNRVAVAGAYAYFTDDTGLHVIDISDPTNPRRVGGNSTIAGGGNFVLEDGGRLFSAGNGRLTIFDLFRSFRLDPLVRDGNNDLRLKMDGPRGVSAWVQRSGDLRQWEDWQPVRFGAAPAELSDPDAVTAPRRFYRAAIR